MALQRPQTLRPDAPPVPSAPPPRALHPTEIDWAAMRRLYPESDGRPMADNTRQFHYIQMIVGGLQALFRDDPHVFVAGDLLWYPVEGHREICQAPDAMVVFGRPKGDRGSYLQFLEGGIPPQVVFEVRSPANSAAEMARKRAFYEQYGVEEYYDYDPDAGVLRVWVRQDGRLVAVPPREVHGWVSPRLRVRFEVVGRALKLYHPDGQPFLPYADLAAQREAERQRAEAERQRAEAERQRAEAERQRAEHANERAALADAVAERERQRAAQADQRAARLAARLRALGIDPDE